MSACNPRRQVDEEECDCSHSDVVSGGLTLGCLFTRHREASRSEIQTVSYRHSALVGAKFCLIWHSLSKPAMFLSSALLLLAACFTGTICLKTLKPQSPLSPRKAPVKDATFASHLPASPPAGQSDFLGSALLSIPLPLGKTILKITRFLCLLTPFLLFM